MATTVTGTNGTNGTNGQNPTAGTKGGNASFSQNGLLGADSITINAKGGKGGKGGNGTGPTANGAKGGDGGNATIALNGNIFNSPATTALKIQGTATGGAGGNGGTSANAAPGAPGNGGNATIAINGNIINPGINMGAIQLLASARGGAGAKYGNASATINGNIVQPLRANNVVLAASAAAIGADDVANHGNPDFGTKTATVNGNIVQGNIRNVSLSAEAGPSNGTARLNGNVVQLAGSQTNIGTVELAAAGNVVEITNNKVHLGKQGLSLSLTQYNPYTATIQNNEFYGTGTNSFTFTVTAIPGPYSNTVAINLANGTFTFNGQNNVLNNFNNVTIGGDAASTLVGNNNANLLAGGLGGDFFTGGQGNDTIDGGDGSDTAIYTGQYAQYTLAFSHVGNLAGTVTDNVASRDGADALTNVEFIQFADGTYDVANDLFVSNNAAPVAVDDAFATNEDTALIVPAGAGLLANDTDAESDPLTVTVVTGPAHGALMLNADGSFSYTPDADYSGADSFTYQANDGTSNSNLATVNLTVNPVNDAPVAGDDTYVTDQNTPLVVPALSGVLANDTDVESDPLTSAVVTGPAHGMLTLNPDGSFTYTPDMNFNGTDSFTYQAHDGTDNSNLATVNLTVNPGSNVLLVGPGGYATIQEAIDAASNGDTILIAPGTYAENVLVNKSVTLTGAGPGVILQGSFETDNGIVGDVNTFLRTAPAYTGAAGTGFAVSADNVTLQNITVDGFLNGVAATGAAVSGLTLNGMTLQDSVFGFVKENATTLTGLSINGGLIDDTYIGVYLYNNDLSGADAIDTTIDGTVFQNVTQKGIYAETAQGNTLFDNLTMTNVGQYGGGVAFGANGAHGGGIDLNLKYHVYTGTVTISDFSFSGVGSSTGTDITGHQNAAAISVKGRDDPGHADYGVNPADVSGLTVNIVNGAIDGTSTGIRAGEAGKANSGLNVTGPALRIENVLITNNLVNGKHDQIDNRTQSVMTVTGTGGDDTYHAAGTATSTGPIRLFGLGGADSLGGGAGDDRLRGGTGNDALNGGAGIDVAVFAGREAQYSGVSLAAVSGGPDGDDTLTNIERLKFLAPSDVSDLDNNGAGDLIFQNTGNGNINIRLQNPVANQPNITGVGVAWKAVGTGKFTADTNRHDSILLQHSGNQNLEVITQLSGAATPTQFSLQPGAGWIAIDTGDFNGDATSDVLLQNGGNARILFTGGAAGSVIGDAAFAAPAGFTAVSGGDFNGDGFSDILWQDSGTGDVQVSLMDGASIKASATLSPGVTADAIGTGDFNGDGLSDILFQDGADALIWTMDGVTQLGSINVAPPVAVGSWAIAGAQDVNGDGYSDILWRDNAAGSTRATLMTAGGAVLNGNFNLASPNASFALIASSGGG